MRCLERHLVIQTFMTGFINFRATFETMTMSPAQPRGPQQVSVEKICRRPLQGTSQAATTAQGATYHHSEKLHLAF